MSQAYAIYSPHVVFRPRPVLVEAMTYRIGHHSTSDDSSAYRGPVKRLARHPHTLCLLRLNTDPLPPFFPCPPPLGDDEVDTFRRDTPIGRLGVYMRAMGLWDDEKEAEMQKVGRWCCQ